VILPVGTGGESLLRLFDLPPLQDLDGGFGELDGPLGKLGLGRSELPLLTDDPGE